MVISSPPQSKLDAHAFDTLVAKQSWFETEEPVFDLTGFTFIPPSVLVQIASACHSLSRDGLRPLLLIPERSVRTYLERSAFITAIEEVADLDPPLEGASDRFERLRGSNPLLIEVTRLDATALPGLLDNIVAVLREKLHYLQRDAFDIAIAISEVAQNSLAYSGGAPGFLAMQVYGKGRRQFLQIGVADCGIGLLASLKENPENAALDGDEIAIRSAMALGTSAHDDPTHGTGLYHLKRIALSHDGTLEIRSGTAKARVRGDKQRDWHLDVPGIPGVQVELSLPRRTRTHRSR